MTTIVLMPGMDGSGELYRWLIDEIGDAAPVHVVSYPVDQDLDYAQLLARLNLPKGPHVVVAESFSGPLAVMYAAQHPPGLCGVLLVASFVRSPVPSVLAGLAASIAGLLPTVPPVRAVRTFMLGDDAPTDKVDAVRACMGLVRPAVLKARLRAVARVDVRRQLSEVAVPVAYLRASEDRLVGDRGWRDVVTIIPSATLFQVASGHLVAQAHPGKVWAAVQVCLRELP